MSLILSGTDGLSDVDGTAATPAIRGTDVNTGIFFGTDIIGFSEGGVEAARIDASGNLGIGTSSPAFKVDISGGGATAKFNTLDTYDGGASLSTWQKVGRRAGTGTNAYINTLHSGSDAVSALTWAFGTSGTGTEAMRLDSSGNLLVGVTTANANGGVLQLKSGITFPATAVAATDANTLDDYEEGTWTPTASNFTVSGTSTLSGTYTKIGRVVYFNLSFANTGTIAFSASALITLPFTGIDSSGMIAMSLYSNSESMTSGKNGVQFVIDASNSRFFVGDFTTTSAGQTLQFGGFYRFS